MKAQVWVSLALLMAWNGCGPSPTEVSDAENGTKSLAAVAATTSGTSTVLINEVDADTPGADTHEFIELYDGGVGNTQLDGLVVVLYNGSSDVSYNAFDLDGFTTDANGYFLLGNAAVSPLPDIVFPNAGLQNGPDAVALYTNDATAFPSGTPVTTDDLIDAVVYDTDDADDLELLALLNAGQPQVNEAGAGDKDTHSSQRIPDGSGGLRNTDTFVQEPATPGFQDVGSPGIALETLVNGVPASEPPGPEVAVGDLVSWIYTVTNVGVAQLTTVTVSADDDVLVTCPASSLAPAESMACSAETVAQDGQNATVATATGVTADGVLITATNLSHYFAMSPMLVKRRVLEELLSRDPTGNVVADRHIGRAIERLGESLNPLWWETESTLDPETGKYVFDRVRQTLNRLSKAIEHDASASGQLERLVDRLIVADRSVVQLAVQAAVEGGARPKLIARAERWMTSAAAAVEDRNWNRALHHYKRAWRTATGALAN